MNVGNFVTTISAFSPAIQDIRELHALSLPAFKSVGQYVYSYPQSCAPPCARKKEGLGTRLGQYAVDDARARARARAIGHIVASNNLVL